MCITGTAPAEKHPKTPAKPPKTKKSEKKCGRTGKRFLGCARDTDPEERGCREKDKDMSKTYVMHNFATGKTVRKTQRTQPRMSGWTCVSVEAVLPAVNARGQHRVEGANGWYYATELADGSHYAP